MALGAHLDLGSVGFELLIFGRTGIGGEPSPLMQNFLYIFDRCRGIDGSECVLNENAVALGGAGFARKRRVVDGVLGIMAGQLIACLHFLTGVSPPVCCLVQK